jgi:predicted transcriptional regulator
MALYIVILQSRIYEKKKQVVVRFIKKHGKVDHSVILNEVNIDYETLMKIISELRQEGLLK